MNQIFLKKLQIKYRHSVKIRVQKPLKVTIILVIRLECNPVSIKFLAELRGFECVPLCPWFSVLFMLFETLCIEDFTFLHALFGEYCLVSIYNKLFLYIFATLLLNHHFKLSLALLCVLLTDVFLFLLRVFASHAC